IQNARLYQRLEQAYVRDRRIAETLQQVLLSDVPPSSPGLEIGHTYRAALDEAVVGGDFYDVFNLENEKVALVIGDVSGKGLLAAVQTARVKFGLRAFASDDPRPDQVVRRLHQSIVQQGNYEGFVTLFFAVFDPNTGILEYANSGHEPPLLQRREGDVEWLARTGTVLGLDLPNSMEFGLETRRIGAGDHLVLYTDGLTEARQNGRFLGRDGLQAVWTKVSHLPSDRAANELYDSIQRFAKGRLTDDVAILVVKFRPFEPLDRPPPGSLPLRNDILAKVRNS
ncbi:MAG: serine/threonine-protein phosphatase, partial [Armatimonadota bacterium]|nr:serine/threonine-protein phosphatase [Armatimonadota bacterium]